MPDEPVSPFEWLILFVLVIGVMVAIVVACGMIVTHLLGLT